MVSKSSNFLAMSFDAQQILSTLYQNPPEMFEVKKAALTKSSFSPPGISPKRQYSEAPVFQVMPPPNFDINESAFDSEETSDFPIINMNQRKSYIPTRNNNIGNPNFKTGTSFASASSLYQPEEDKYFPYSESHLRALFDDYNLTISHQQFELFQIAQNIERIRKLIKINENEKNELAQLLNEVEESSAETFTESQGDDDVETQITETLRQNFQDSQQLSEEMEKVSDFTEQIELYQNFNEKCKHYVNSDISKETDDIIEKLSKTVENNDNQMNETVKSYELKVKQKDAIIAELQERIMKIKNPDYDPNKDPNIQVDSFSPKRDNVQPLQKNEGFPAAMNDSNPSMKKAEPFPSFQNTEAFPTLIKKNNSFPNIQHTEAFPSIKKK